MYQIQNLTDDPVQTMTLVLPDGNNINLSIRFASMQFGWFITELDFGSLTFQGIRIVNSPNILRPWKNLIPFGLACFSTADREPSQAQDLSSGASLLYILTPAEVLAYEEFLSG